MSIVKNNKIISVLSFFCVFPAFSQSSGGINGEMKSTATIENSCLIAAENINFGQVVAPLANQGAQSQMRVLCSKNTNYTIDLAYGGVYGSGGGMGDGSFWLIENRVGGTYIDYVRYAYFNTSGTKTGEVVCRNGFKEGNEGTTPKDVTCRGYTLSPYESVTWGSPARAEGNSIAYNYGAMNGGLKGDKLAYKITVPGDISKVWNVGNNSYTEKGTGEAQVIDINAQIVPTKSSSLYPAQDMYMDTVTAIISY